MRFVILTTGYPEEGNYYKNAFIHQRVLKYIENGHDCTVLVNNMKKGKREYYFEGVRVIEGDYDNVLKSLRNSKFDKLLIHFINTKIIKMIDDLKINSSITIWIHGIEALSWKRRLFNFFDPGFFRYVIVNMVMLRNLSNFILTHDNLRFVFVSNWMKEIMEEDLKLKINNYKIIPNVINDELFSFVEKTDDMRKNILLIRNFSSKKYANDLSIKAILKLAEKSYFEDLNFAIYGKGKYFTKLTSHLVVYKNIEIHEKFLSQKEIAKKHKDFGLFLCPTRQDAQGVSMCEAMSSGLVPITSNNTAIPEFVSEEAGYLTDNQVDSIVSAIEELYFDEELFNKMSNNSSTSIQEKCNPREVIKNELAYIVT